MKKSIFILVLLYSCLGFSESMASYICEPVLSINLEETKGKPSNPAYIPLFQTAQNRLDEINKEYFKGITDESAEAYCGIIYDCAPLFADENGQITFKDCNDNSN